MKIINFILLTLLFTSLTSCDKEFQIDQATSNSTTESSKFLNSYYSKAFSEGKSININNNTMKLTEILGINQKTPIGYTVTSIDNSELLYFIDVNTAKNTLKSIDFKNIETVYFSLDKFINEQKIKNINNFNFLNLINNLNTNFSKVKFWGWTCGGSYDIEPGSCYRTCCYRVLGVVAGCDSYGCSNLPGKNPLIIN